MEITLSNSTLSEAVFIPSASNKELPKIHLAFEREWQRHEVSVSTRLEHQLQTISGVQPNGPTSIGWDNFQRLRWLVCSVDAVLLSNVRSTFTASALGWGAGRDASPFAFERHYHHESSIALVWKKSFCLSDLRLILDHDVVELRMLLYSRTYLVFFCTYKKPYSFATYGNVFLRIFLEVCCICIMSDNVLADKFSKDAKVKLTLFQKIGQKTFRRLRHRHVLAVCLFWRNDLGCASVVPSEQTSSSSLSLRASEREREGERGMKSLCFSFFSFYDKGKIYDPSIFLIMRRRVGTQTLFDYTHTNRMIIIIMESISHHVLSSRQTGRWQDEASVSLSSCRVRLQYPSKRCSLHPILPWRRGKECLSFRKGSVLDLTSACDQLGFR